MTSLLANTAAFPEALKPTAWPADKSTLEAEGEKMALIAVIVVVGVVLAGHFLRRRPSWRRAIAVVASVAVLLPMIAASSATASPHDQAHRSVRPEILEAEANPWELPAVGGLDNRCR